MGADWEVRADEPACPVVWAGESGQTAPPIPISVGPGGPVAGCDRIPYLMRSLLIAGLILCGAAFAFADEEPGAPRDSTDTGTDGRIYLSWGAGYGLPGADSSFSWKGGEAGRVDTLYLSFSPGKACSTFMGMTASVWFRALDGDTLGPIWSPPGGKKLPDFMNVEFQKPQASGYAFPWNSFGIGHPAYAKTSSSAGSLRLVWAVMPDNGVKVTPGTRYALARIILTRPPAGSPGFGQPVCVEWNEASMAYRPGDEPVVASGVRFVGLNSAGGTYGCGNAPPPEASRSSSGKAKKAPSGR